MIPDALISSRAALILLLAALVGGFAGYAAIRDGRSPWSALLIAGGAAGAALALFITMVGG